MASLFKRLQFTACVHERDLRVLPQAFETGPVSIELTRRCPGPHDLYFRNWLEAADGRQLYGADRRRVLLPRQRVMRSVAIDVTRWRSEPVSRRCPPDGDLSGGPFRQVSF